MRDFYISCLLTLTSTILGGATALAQNDATEKALKVITDTASAICTAVPLESSSSGLSLSGDARAKLSGVIGRIADLGIEGTGDYKAGEEKRAVLERDLAAAIKDTSNCRLEVFRSLQEKLVPRQGQSSEIAPKASSMNQDFGMVGGQSLFLTKDRIIFSAIGNPIGGRSNLFGVRLNGKVERLAIGQSVNFASSEGTCSVTLLEIPKVNNGKFYLRC